jgi:hypothetical protein
VRETLEKIMKGVKYSIYKNMVLLPEITIRMMMEDHQLEYAGAHELMMESRGYGNALFGEY